MTDLEKRKAPTINLTQNPYPDLRDPDIIKEDDMHSKINLTDEQPVATSKVYNFQFTGKGAEYFKIWMVNLTLNILTLSLYQPWAKVRNKRYFYGNTLLDGHAFEYDAEPWKLFKGRLIAIGFFIAYLVVSNFFPLVSLGLFVLIMLLTPLVIMLSLRFNARYSSYRGIRFRFQGSYGHILWLYVIYPIIAMLPSAVLLPHVWYKQSQYYVEQHGFGQKPFVLQAGAWGFYKMALLLLVFAAVLIGGLIGAAMWLVDGSLADGVVYSKDPMVLVFLMSMYFSIFFVLLPFYWYRLYNLVYGTTKIADLHFHANMTYRGYMAVIIKNVLFCVLTLGIYYPWAKVNLALYKASVTYVDGGDIEQFVAISAAEKTSLGDQFGEVFDIDVGL